MKKIIISAFLVVFTLNAFCQQITSSELNKTSADYLKKSKKQKKIAWLLLGGGAAIVVTGILLPAGEKEEYEAQSFFTKYKNGDTKVILYILGGGAIGTSLSFFDASGNNKYRVLEASAFIDIEKTHGLQAFIGKEHSFPVLGVKLRL